jgi:hypothetical protein
MSKYSDKQENLPPFFMNAFYRILFFLMTFQCLYVTAGLCAVLFKSNKDAEIYLLTCSPGNKVETIYGHSAIRIVDHVYGTDSVYNWGVYDFRVPNFVWKFAIGRLSYQVTSNTFDRFILTYQYEKRTVYSSKINLNETEKAILFDLIQSNLRPENRYYLYDFFYDNCATRIRDLMEETLGKKLIYPETSNQTDQTFRQMINQAQLPMPWLTLGTDLLIGLPGDKKAGFRQQMFLPGYLAENLSSSSIRRQDSSVPLLEKSTVLLDFNHWENVKPGILRPIYFFPTFFLVIAFISFYVHQMKFSLWLDRSLFLIFSIMAVFMIFFNFITDHTATKLNLNIIWLNPLLIIAFLSLFSKTAKTFWFSILFFIATIFLVAWIFLPQSLNPAFIPLILIIIIRTYFRSDFMFHMQK